MELALPYTEIVDIKTRVSFMLASVPPIPNNRPQTANFIWPLIRQSLPENGKKVCLFSLVLDQTQFCKKNESLNTQFYHSMAPSLPNFGG